MYHVKGSWLFLVEEGGALRQMKIIMMLGGSLVSVSLSLLRVHAADTRPFLKRICPSIRVGLRGEASHRIDRRGRFEPSNQPYMISLILSTCQKNRFSPLLYPYSTDVD